MYKYLEQLHHRLKKVFFTFSTVFDQSIMSSKSGWSNLYHYDPIIPVAGVAAGLYTVAFIAVLWQTIKYKKRYMHTVTVTAFCECNWKKKEK
jgi:hypothetical protein